MTPPTTQMKFHLEERRRWFRNKWLFSWHQISSERGAEIDTFDGGQAKMGGIEYSGSAMHMFWDTITRGVRKEITEQFAWLDEQVRRYNSETANRAIEECGGLLVSFAEGVRRDAVEKDRILRGRHGTPAAKNDDRGQWYGANRGDILDQANALKIALRPDASPERPAQSTSLDHLEKQILAALVIDHYRPGDRLLDREAFETGYFIHAAPQSVDAIIEDLGESGLVEVFRDKEGASAILRPASLKRALQQVMEDLKATTFEVDSKKERVLADAQPFRDFPLPKGWDFVTFAREESDLRPPEPIWVDSASWTGPARGEVLTESQRAKLLAAIGAAGHRVEELALDNSKRAQVLALIGAAKQLAEAPEPPADMVWELVQRAAAILGIAGFFAQVLTAFT